MNGQTSGSERATREGAKPALCLYGNTACCLGDVLPSAGRRLDQGNRRSQFVFGLVFLRPSPHRKLLSKAQPTTRAGKHQEKYCRFYRCCHPRPLGWTYSMYPIFRKKPWSMTSAKGEEGCACLLAGSCWCLSLVTAEPSHKSWRSNQIALADSVTKVHGGVG